MQADLREVVSKNFKKYPEMVPIRLQPGAERTGPGLPQLSHGLVLMGRAQKFMKLVWVVNRSLLEEFGVRENVAIYLQSSRRLVGLSSQVGECYDRESSKEGTLDIQYIRQMETTG